MELTITAEGIQGFHHPDMDKMDFGGERKIRRASDIEFNEASQMWEVRRVEREKRVPSVKGQIMVRELSEVLFQSPEREACIEWEVANEPIISGERNYV